MYNLSPYNEASREDMISFMRKHPFSLICGSGKDHQPVATQVPVFIDERDDKLFLHGHVMRKTDHHLAMTDNPKVLAVFTGPDTYVSASWYTNKNQGSTWNYMSVHATGLVRFLSEPELIGILQRTTDHFENNPHSGANFKDIPEDYIQRLVKAIVGFEIEVTHLANVFKLSQDKNEASFENVTEHLHSQGGDAASVAAEMAARKDSVYPKPA